MTTEDKELLLKDLCARLPYGVKAVLTRTNCNDFINKVSEKDLYSFRTGRPLEEDYGQHDYYKVVVTDIKPYLFPISSMTEEQIVEFDKIAELDIEYSITQIKNDVLIWTSGLNRFNWLLKNHFDVYGLIEQDLAIDCTNLNIY